MEKRDELIQKTLIASQEKKIKELEEQNRQLTEMVEMLRIQVDAQKTDIPSLIDELNAEIQATRETYHELKELQQQILNEKNYYVNRMDEAVKNITG